MYNNKMENCSRKQTHVQIDIPLHQPLPPPPKVVSNLQYAPVPILLPLSLMFHWDLVRSFSAELGEPVAEPDTQFWYYY